MIELKNIDHFRILVGKLDISKRYYMQIFSGIFFSSIVNKNKLENGSKN